MRPIDSIMVNMLSPKGSSNTYSNFNLNSESENHLENLDHPEGKDSTDESYSKSNIEEHLVIDSNSNSSMLPNNYIYHDEESPTKALLYAIFAPQNICTLLGIYQPLLKQLL